MASALTPPSEPVVHCAISHSVLKLHEFPVHAAAACGCPETLARVIAACSWRDVYSSDESGRTPLHLAAAAGAAASVTFLTHPAMLELQHGVVGNALNAVDRENGWTALHTAAFSGHLQVMSILLGAGADASIRDCDGMTPWEILEESLFFDSNTILCTRDSAVPLPGKVGWCSMNQAEALSFGLTTNYCLGYDSACNVVARPRSVSLPSHCALLSVACSGSLSLFVTKDGAVYACGLGDHDRLMIPVPYCVEPIRLASLPPSIVSVAIGKRHCLALTEGGDVYGWGSNDQCQLGSTHAARQQQRAIPLKILSGISAIAAGFAHSAAVSRDGVALFVWGDNSACQCCQPRTCSLVRSPSVAQIPSGFRVTAVSCGQRHTSFVATPDVTSGAEKSEAYMFGVGCAAIMHLLLLPALSQTHWHVMPDCKVAAVAAGDDWTAVVTQISQRCYLWRHSVGQVGSPSVVPIARHVTVCRATAAPSRLVLLLSDSTVVSVPVHKRSSDHTTANPETLCRRAGCSSIAASDGTCLLVCSNLLLCDDGIWSDVAAGSVLSLQRMCEVALCPALTSTLAPSALQLALSVGAPVLAVAATFACLMDPMYTLSCSFSELAWGLMETVLSRLKLGSKSFGRSAHLVRAVARDLVDDWGGLLLHLMEFEAARVCTGSWEAAIPRLSRLTKTKLKQKMEPASECKSQEKRITSPPSICSPVLSACNHVIPPNILDAARELSEVPELRSDSPHLKSAVLSSEPSLQTQTTAISAEHFPPLAHDVHVHKLSSARSRQPRKQQCAPLQPRVLPPAVPSVSPASSPTPALALDPQEFPMLSPPPMSNPATPQTKVKVRCDQNAAAQTSTLELGTVAVPNTATKGNVSSKKQRQKYRYVSNAFHASLTQCAVLST